MVTLALGVLAPLAAGAQQLARVPRIGLLSNGSGQSPHVKAFGQGLRELGYVEGQNIRIDRRFAEGKSERLPDLAAELVRLQVDIIVAPDPPATRAAKNATRTIPIVMRTSHDPVASGLVARLPRPGGNITGLYSLYAELSPKRLELLKEVVPGLTRVAVLWNPANPGDAPIWRETEAAARSLGVQLQSLEVQRPDDFESAFGAATRERAGALITLRNPLIVTHKTRIVNLAAKSQLPAMYDDRDKTAKALGLTIPQSVLFRADQVIE
jgi:putative ABC transport system substrate-binding protein